MNETTKLRVNDIVASFPDEWDGASILQARARIAARPLHGTVRICAKVISLFQYALTYDDADAWSILLSLYRDTAFRQASAKLNEEEAEEVAQEVMTKLWINRASLRPTTNLGGWVRVMARNAATDLIRRRRTWQEEVKAGVLEEEPEWVEPEGDMPEEYNFLETVDLDSPEALLEAYQTLEILCDTADKLPPKAVQALSLLGDGDSYDTIAWKLGIGPDAARAMASRAKQYMLEQLHMKTKSKR